MSYIWSEAEEALEWCTFGDAVYQAIMEINRVYEGGGPKFGWEAGPVEQCSDTDGQFVIINLDSTTL